MGILSSWGKVFEKIADHIQGRTERRRNELDTIEDEIALLKKGKCTAWKSARLSVLIARRDKLYRLFKNG